MKKQVKKFMSALLACVMVAVSVIVFDMNPVHAASGAKQKHQAGLRQHMLSGHL